MRALLKGSLVLLLSLASVLAVAAIEMPQNQPDPIEQAGNSVTLQIIPSLGVQGSEHTILANGLTPNQDISLRIIENTSQAEVYSTSGSANSNGRYQHEIFSTGDDIPGEYTVVLTDGSGDSLADAALTIAARQTQQGSLSAVQSADAAYEITITDVRPFADLVINVRDAANDLVYTTEVRASVDGDIVFAYIPEADVLSGTYSITALDRGVDEVASATIEVEQVAVDANAAIVEQPEQEQPAEGEPAVAVTPQNVAQGDAFTVSITGLEADTSFSLMITPAESDETIYSTERSAENDGSFVLSLRSSLGDTPGGYVVTVMVDGEMVAETPFVIRSVDEPEEAAPEETEAPAVEETPTEEAEAEAPEEEQAAPDVQLTLTPPEGDTTTSFIVTITGLAAEQAIDVDVVADGETVSSSALTADVNGNVISLLEAELGAGSYGVRVVADGETLAESSLTVAAAEDVETGDAEQAEAGAVTVLVVPETGPIGTSYTITAIGLGADQEAMLDIVFDGSVVFSTSTTADVNGNALFSIVSEEGDPAGTYTANIMLDGVVAGSVDFAIEGAIPEEETVEEQPTETPDPETPAAPVEGVAVSVNPLGGPQGETYVVTVQGLEAGAAVTLDIAYDGASVFSTDRNADAFGNVQLSLTTSDSDPLGDYTISVVADGETVASTVLVLTDGEVPEAAPTEAPETATEAPPASTAAPEVDGVTVTVDPSNAAAGTTRLVVVDGLEPQEVVVINLSLNDDVIFSTPRLVGASGRVVVDVLIPADALAGTYLLEVLRGGAEVVGTADVIVGTETGSADPVPAAPPETSDGEVIVTIDPTAGPIGTDHTITISGLDADERVTLDVFFDDVVVFTTERNADDAGTITIVLQADPGDAEGIYTVQVARNNGALASSNFTVGAESVITPDSETGVSVAVDPNSGPIGTSHTVTVSGLDMNTEIDIAIIFEDSSVFSTTIAVDETGVATLNLVSEEGDQLGNYTVEASVGGEIVAQTSFAITSDVASVEEGQPEAPTETEDTPASNFSDRVSASQPENRITIDGQEGETIIISLTSPDFDTYLILEDDQGNELAFNDDGGDGLNSRIGPFILPYSGSYTVVATSYAYATGGEAVGGAFEVSVARAVTQSLAFDTTVSATFDATTTDQIYTFDVAAGDVIEVTVTSGGSIDTQLSLLDPSGMEVFFDDDSGAGLDPEILGYVAAASGTYTLSLNAYNAGDVGTVELLAARTVAPTLDDGPQRINLNSLEPTATLSVMGTAGETISLVIERVEDVPGNLFVSVSQNGVQLLSYSTSSLPQSISLPFEVTADGPMTILIEDYSGAASTLDVSVSR